MKKNWIIALLAVYGMAATVMLLKRPLFPPPGTFGATEEAGEAEGSTASPPLSPSPLLTPSSSADATLGVSSLGLMSPPVTVAEVVPQAGPEEPVESPLVNVVQPTGPAGDPVVAPTGIVAAPVAKVETSEVLSIFSNTFGQVSNMVWNLAEGPGASPMQNALRLEGRQRAAKRYGDFLSRFELTDKQRQEMLDALALGEAPPGAGAVEGAGAEAVRGALREQVGEGGLAMFDAFEKTVAGRDAVRSFDQSLGEHLALSVEQRDGLIPLMNRAAELRDSIGDESLGMEGLSKEAADPETELNELQVRYNDVLRGAAPVLNQEQLNALSSHLQDQMEMAEAETRVRTNLRERLQQK